MRGCARNRERILRAVDGTLPIEERFRLEDHVTRCDSCSREFELATRVEDALERMPEPPVHRLDVEDAVGRVRAALEAAPLEVPAEPLAQRRPFPLARVVAALVLGALALTFAAVALTPDGDAPETVAALDVPADPDAVDPARLAEVRARVRNALAEELVEPGDVATGIVAFDARVDDLRRAGWPLVRLAEEALDDERPDVVMGALTLLGARGDRLSARRVRDRADDESVRAAALLALGAMGDAGLDELADALRSSALAAPALQALERVGGDTAGLRIVAALERHERLRAGPLTWTELVRALARTGPGAVRPLLAIAARQSTSSDEYGLVLAALSDVPGGARALAELVENESSRRRAGVSEELLLAAVRRLQPDEALPWLVSRANGSRLQVEALDVLATYRGPAAVHAFVTLLQDDRVPAELLDGAARSVLAADPDSAAELARRCAVEGEHDDASSLLRLLVLASVDGLGPALLELALCEGLSGDERQLAALAIGELGGRDDVEALADELAELSREDRRLAAAILISIHRLAGADAVAAALRPSTPARRERIQRLVTDSAARGDVAVPLVKLARELDGWFAEKKPKPWKQTS